MPIPALNIIATHETVRNSGFSPSRPSGIFPYRLTASHSANTTKPLAASTNAHPPAFMTPASTAAATALSVWVASVPQTMNATTSAAATPKTHQSTGWRCSAEPSWEAVSAGEGSLPPGVSRLLGVSEMVILCGPDGRSLPLTCG
jgi:hypothetical protein